MNKEEQKQYLIDLMRMDEEAGLYEDSDLTIPNLDNCSISLVKPLPPSSFIFCLKQDEPPIIVIDEKGFQYKGELIEDAGEVYKLLKEFLQNGKTI
jgi:hypothetical protein